MINWEISPIGLKPRPKSQVDCPEAMNPGLAPSEEPKARCISTVGGNQAISESFEQSREDAYKMPVYEVSKRGFKIFTTILHMLFGKVPTELLFAMVSVGLSHQQFRWIDLHHRPDQRC
eukprot:GHVL01034116.1.p3 GENE.GHVL01034116.1~~GHVL01034116.1.p3  ORF type:complete len:119 (-),score=1.13 GHVL01034116.1:37-393(-)